MGLDSPLFNTIHHIMDLTDDTTEKNLNAPTRTYVRDAKAMAATPADVKEYPNSYVFVVDMPGLKSGDIKVQVEDENVLLISGERKREEEKEGGKYLKMERRVGKFMRNLCYQRMLMLKVVFLLFVKMVFLLLLLISCLLLNLRSLKLFRLRLLENESMFGE